MAACFAEALPFALIFLLSHPSPARVCNWANGSNNLYEAHTIEDLRGTRAVETLKETGTGADVKLLHFTVLDILLLTVLQQVTDFLLHTGLLRETKKSIGYNTYAYVYARPYFDRLDYASTRLRRPRKSHGVLRLAKEALTYSFMGVMLRSSSIPWGLIKVRTYNKYNEVEFDIPVVKNGDCYDRYLYRVQRVPAHHPSGIFIFSV
ncbi:respiratory-chain NADH dehydrogenase [Suillus ampliporus]|nr:respiratory-chain NADH dehydrogenase [Suillus ampliporus]